MKIAIRFLFVVACFLMPFAADAAKFSYPSEDKEWFTVDIPASWKPTVGDDESLEATSPDEEAYLAFWVAKDAKEIKGLDKDIEELVKDSVKKLKLGEKPIEKTINGIPFTIFAGTGLDVDDNTPVGVEIFLFSPKPGKVGIFYCQYGQKAPAAMNLNSAVEG